MNTNVRPSTPTTTPILSEEEILAITAKAMAAILGYGRRDEHLRADVRSDVMFGIALGLADVDRTVTRDEIRKYLFLRAKWEALNGFQARKPGTRKLPQEQPYSLNVMTDFGFDIRTPGDWVRRADDRIMCGRALSLMTPIEQKVCVAHHVYDLSYTEVGLSIDRSGSRARQIATEACSRVRRKLLAPVV